MNKLNPLPVPPGEPANSFEQIIIPFRFVFWVIELILYFVTLPVQFVLDLETFLNGF